MISIIGLTTHHGRIWSVRRPFARRKSTRSAWRKCRHYPRGSSVLIGFKRKTRFHLGENVDKKLLSSSTASNRWWYECSQKLAMETETNIQRQYHCSRFELRTSNVQQTAPLRKIQNLNLGRLSGVAECTEPFTTMNFALPSFSVSKERNSLEKNSSFWG